MGLDNYNIICKVKYSILSLQSKRKRWNVEKKAQNMSSRMRRFPAVPVHSTSVFQAAQRYWRQVTLTAVQNYEALGYNFSRRGREIAVGYRLCSEGNRVHWMHMMLKVQELMNLSTSPSLTSSMGYHHHHIRLNIFSWYSVSFKDIPHSKQGW